HARAHPGLAAARARLAATGGRRGVGARARARDRAAAAATRDHGTRTARARRSRRRHGAMPAAQMAELAGHPSVAILLGGIAGWEGDLEEGAVELEPVREAGADLEANPQAFPTRQELATRLADATLTILDVRTPDEYTGRRGNQCDPRQGHIPGARNLDVGELFEGPGRPASPERVRELVGLPEGTEIVAYCHSGSRSALATLALRAAGYDARNYAGSWHEWSRHDELPLER